MFLDTTKLLLINSNLISNWASVYKNIIDQKEDNISMLAYKYCFAKAKNYYNDFLRKSGCKSKAQGQLKQVNLNIFEIFKFDL